MRCAVLLRMAASVLCRNKKIKIRTVQSDRGSRTPRLGLRMEACPPSLPASMTIEAAICFPLILFACFLLMTPLRAMEERRRLQNRMEAAAKDAASAAYLVSVAEDIKNRKAEGLSQSIEGLSSALVQGAAAGKILACGEEKVLKNLQLRRLRFPQSNAGEQQMEDDTGEAEALIEMEVSYEIKLPFSIFRFDRLSQSAVASRRAWIGSEGGRGRSRYGGGQKQEGYDLDDDGNRLVYVGKTGTRYHKDKNCHYISNKMLAVDGDSIEEMRNHAGGKYHACASCRPSGAALVYIFEEGSAYHASESCKAIGSYARVHKLEEVEHLGACSYCG